jgi:CheY-like chemotaxis protein
MGVDAAQLLRCSDHAGLHHRWCGQCDAGDALRALPLIGSGERLDLLLSDVGLPGIHGLQLADLALESTPKLNVLFMTGFAEGAWDIYKPFAMGELAARCLPDRSGLSRRRATESGARELHRTGVTLAHRRGGFPRLRPVM